MVAETDLAIYAERDLSAEAEGLVLDVREEIEHYARRFPEFLTSFHPLTVKTSAPKVVEEMLNVSRQYSVGPMAAVAGAVAENVGRGLLRLTSEVIVENGGDVFLKTHKPVKLGVYAGEESPLRGKMRFRLPAGEWGVCTSSRKVGHSVSLGNADAVVAVAHSAALADAAATALANRLKDPDDLSEILESEKKRKVLRGLVMAMDQVVGLWGDIELVK